MSEDYQQSSVSTSKDSGMRANLCFAEIRSNFFLCRWSHCARTKVDTFIEFPLNGLDMSQYLLRNLSSTRYSNANSCLYDLAAVIVHHGNGMGSGRVLSSHHDVTQVTMLSLQDTTQHSPTTARPGSTSTIAASRRQTSRPFRVQEHTFFSMSRGISTRVKLDWGQPRNLQLNVTLEYIQLLQGPHWIYCRRSDTHFIDTGLQHLVSTMYYVIDTS